MSLLNLQSVCWHGLYNSQAPCKPLDVAPGEEEGRPSQGSSEDLDPDLAGCAWSNDRGVPHRADR